MAPHLSERPFDAFACHNHDDSDVVAEICERLRDEAELEPWLDRDAISPGVDWDCAITAALQGCSSFIVFLGPHGWGMFQIRELTMAFARKGVEPGFRIIPVLLPGAREQDCSEVPTLAEQGATETLQKLGAIQWVDFRSGGIEDRAAFVKLSAAIQGRTIAPHEIPTISPYRLKKDAARWQQAGRIPKLLYRGGDLDEAESLATKRADRLNDLAIMFLAASAARAQRTTRLTFISCVSAVLLLSVIGLAIIFYRSQARFEHSAAEEAKAKADQRRTAALVNEKGAQASQLALAAGSTLDRDQELSLALGIEGVRITQDLPLSAVQIGSFLNPLTPQGRYFSEHRALPESINALHRGLLSISPWHTVRGPNSPINCVSWRHGSNHLAAAGDDMVRVWDGQTGKELLTLRDITRITDCAYSPDGTQIATANMKGEVMIWDASSGEKIHTLRHGSLVGVIVWSPNGKFLAFGGAGAAITIWRLSDPSPIRTIAAQHEVLSIAWHPNGREIASAGLYSPVEIWDVASGSEIAHLSLLGTDKHSGIHIAWSPDGKDLVTAGPDDTARLWSRNDLSQPILTLTQPEAFTSVAWNPMKRMVVTTGDGDTVKVWDTDTGAELYTLSSGFKPYRTLNLGVQRAAWSSDGKWLATANGDSTITVWRPTLNYEVSAYGPNQNEVLSASISPDGKTVALGIGPGFVRSTGPSMLKLFRFADASLNKEILLGSPPTSMSWSPDGQRFGIACSDRSLIVWKSPEFRNVHVFNHGEPYRYADVRPTTIAWSSDGKRIATTAFDDTVKIWDSDDDRLLVRLHDNKTVLSAAWNPQGQEIATYNEACIVRVWDSVDARVLAELKLESNQTCSGIATPVSSISWSSDGKRLAIPGPDNAVDVWDAKSRRLLFKLAGHAGPVRAAVWSPNGAFLATASLDRTVRVWDSGAPGPALFTLPAHVDDVRAVAWTPDGKHLISGSSDHWAKLHTIDVDELLAIAAIRVQRGLTTDERSLYLH